MTKLVILLDHSGLICAGPIADTVQGQVAHDGLVITGGHNPGVGQDNSRHECVRRRGQEIARCLGYLLFFGCGEEQRQSHVYL